MDNRDIERKLNNVEIKPSLLLKEKVLSSTSKIVRTESVKAKKWSIKRLAVAVSLCLILLVGGVFGAGFGLYNENYINVYVDINPSVQLTVNRFNVVNKITYLNDDAKTVFSQSQVVGEKIENALNTIMAGLEESSYFETNSQLYVSGYSDKVSVENILAQYSNFCEDYMVNKELGVNVNCEKLTKEDVVKGIENKMSPVKNKFIDQLITMGEEFEESLDKNDLKDWTMENIKEKFKEFNDKKNQNNGHGEEKPNNSNKNKK